MKKLQAIRAIIRGVQRKRLRPISAALMILMVPCAASGQSALQHFLSAASTNSTKVFGAPAFVSAIIYGNTTNTIYYLKLYNKATAPTCNTDPVIATIPLQATKSEAIPLPQPARFSAGLGFCLTGGIADNDDTNAAAGVALDFAFSGSP